MSSPSAVSPEACNVLETRREVIAMLRLSIYAPAVAEAAVDLLNVGAPSALSWDHGSGEVAILFDRIDDATMFLLHRRLWPARLPYPGPVVGSVRRHVLLSSSDCDSASSVQAGCHRRRRAGGRFGRRR